MMTYSYPNEPVAAESPLGLVVHHPLFGIALKREMDKLGLEEFKSKKGWKVTVKKVIRASIPAKFKDKAMKWLDEHGQDLDLVLVSRYYVLAPAIKSIRRLCPNARLVFDTVDLHFLREQRDERESHPVAWFPQAQTGAVRQQRQEQKGSEQDSQLVREGSLSPEEAAASIHRRSAPAASPDRFRSPTVSSTLIRRSPSS
jgi:hypothetical protein